MSTQFRDSDLTRYLQMIDGLDLASLRTAYVFDENSNYKRRLEKSIGDGMRVYWKEILCLCHLSSVVSILRTRRWFSAIADSIDRGNVLAFAASLRGCMESAADSATSLKIVPLTLAERYSEVKRALEGDLDYVLISPELENELIHFSHARHISRRERKNVSESHIARTTHTYLKVLSEGRVPNVEEVYRTVCDLTHPAASSVSIWLSVGPSSAALFSGQDQVLIRGVLESNRQLLLELAMFAFNPAVLTLRMINEFSLHELYVQDVDKWKLEGIDGWNKCAEAFGRSDRCN